MWVTAVLGAIELGLAIWQAIESGKDKPKEPVPVQAPNVYSATQAMLGQEFRKQEEVEANLNNQIRNNRAANLSQLNDLYRDPQSRFIGAIGINKMAVDQEAKAASMQSDVRRNLLGTQLAISEGSGNLWRSIQDINMKQYEVAMNQYNREQEAWGSAASAGIGNIANSFLYDQTKKV